MTSDATAVAVEQVSKTFRISTDPVMSFKERLVRLWRTSHVTFDALRDVSIDVRQGETVGIIGHNGSGKSTLLKCMAGIITPTSGQVLVRGRLTSLLELGAGFHPELSGRENVYINAAFYGMARKEIDRRFDEIVAFAELDRFIDEPVKHYSSGMYVRLGFAVAVNLDPDVLLVDEVLAVGDELFQAKCLSRIKQFQREGRTIVFVTHDAATVRQICDRAVVLDRGSVIVDGRPDEAISTFREHLHGSLSERPALDGEALGDGGVIAEVASRPAGADGDRSGRFHIEPGGGVDLRITLRPVSPIAEPIVAIEISDRNDTLVYSADTDGLGIKVPPIEEACRLVLGLERVWLLSGEFHVSIKLLDRADGAVHGWREHATTFEVRSPRRAEGIAAIDVTLRREPG